MQTLKTPCSSKIDILLSKKRLINELICGINIIIILFVLGFYGPVNHGVISSAVSLFVCVGVLQPSQPNGVMSSAISLPNHTFTGQA